MAPDLAALAAQQGFAGTMEIRDGCCHWARELDYQPAGGPPDIGQMTFEGSDRVRCECALVQPVMEPCLRLIITVLMCSGTISRQKLVEGVVSWHIRLRLIAISVHVHDAHAGAR